MARSRLIIMAMPSLTERDAMQGAVRDLGLDRQLGPEMFDPRNWHQSLSDSYDDLPDIREAMLRACASVSAASFTLILNRIGGKPGFWEFRAFGKPKGFAVLLSALRSALQAEGFKDETGHSPHVTISYEASSALEPVMIEPIHWVIDSFVLVRGGGKPYRYEELGRWSLAPAAVSSQSQLGLQF